MLRRIFWVSSVVASLALMALLEASAVQAGPSSGGRSYPYRVGSSYSSSYSYAAPATVIAGEPGPANGPDAIFYAYYAPAVRRAAGGEEESDVAGTSPARIELTVPANAAVWLDGHKTQQTGSARAFITPPLQQGKTFDYELRVRWTAPGGIVVDVTRPIQVRGGRQTVVGFKQ